MFEQEYKKMFRDVKPSRDLETETLGLLIEMRDHPPVEPAPTRRLKPFIISTAASLAAVFILTFIGIGVHRGMLNKRMESELLLDDSLAEDITQDSLFEDEEKSDMDAEAPEQDEESADSDEDDSAADKKEESPAEDDKDGTSNTDEEDDRGSMDEDKSEDKNDDKSDSNQTPSVQDELIQEYYEEYKGAGSNNSGAMLYIQRNCPPVENNTGGIRTYLSIKDFADALEKKSTLGYGTRYYNARELLIVPTKLPTDCYFRQLYLNHTTGAYTYQYGAAYMGHPYLVTVENKSPRAKSLQELKDQISYLPGEEVEYSIDGNVMTYTFGAETVTVTVTAAVKGAEITDNACRALFNDIDLSRATLDNEILMMTFPKNE